MKYILLIRMILIKEQWLHLPAGIDHLDVLLKYQVGYPISQSEKYLEYILHIFLLEIQLYSWWNIISNTYVIS